MAGSTERGDWLYKQEMDGIQYKFKVFALGIFSRLGSTRKEQIWGMGERREKE